MSKSKDHLHIYERVGGARQTNPRFRCIDPDCHHFNTKDMIKGKRASCACGSAILLGWRELQLKHPKCKKCSKGKRNAEYLAEKKDFNVIKDILKQGLILGD